MKYFSHDIVEKLLKTLIKYYHFLLNFQGVHYLDIGYKFLNGRPESHLSLRVHVFKKKPVTLLDPQQVLPRFIENLPVDIIQSQPVLHSLNRNDRFDPIIGGIAVRNPRYSTLGTLGCTVYDKSTQNPMGLSNYHVLVGEEGAIGDRITQPPTENDNDTIGHVVRWNEQLDCAVCSIVKSRRCSPEILGIPKIPSSIREPAVGMRVVKSGRTTGVTHGLIDGVSPEGFTIIPLPDNADPFTEISAPGDSGSIWLDEESGDGVGLHYAGENDPAPEAERAWAKNLKQVFNILNINF